MIDILIPLGTGSKYDNLELKYCLRSVEKHLKGVNRVFIVGERPEWINWEQEIIFHIACSESIDNKNFAHNIYTKIIVGIRSIANISSNFFFINDDHFLLKDFEAGKFPYLHRGPIIPHRISGEATKLQMANTRVALWNAAILSKRGTYTDNDYDIHCPVVYDKGDFVNFFRQLPKEWPAYGYGIKSFYCNLANVEGKLVEDLKFREPLMKQSIYNVLKDQEWFSIGDTTLREGAMQEVLQELYSDKSKYEL